MAVHEALVQERIELVCLAGFMRIVTKEFVKLWEGKLINIHPSLLPSFPGVKTHEAVLAANVRIHGCTVHFVDEGVDTGSIILQEAVPVLLTDTVETLQERVKNEAEHKIFPLALEHLARGEVVFDKKLRKAIWTI
ncbi:Trifunctional purine biosynthetic protein adenosine-3 [Halotydeus destructor]|nr:Trifunctional purine biosynthetic protein adenosine-3 [Halotydeus destructor]